MKVQRLIRIFCYAILLNFLNGEDLSLSPEDNNERLAKCGKFDNQHPANIISWAQNKEDTQPLKTAALISKRHFLVSSSIVLEGKDWIHNKTEKFDTNICRSKENGHIDVPQDALKSFGTGFSTNFKRAVIICNTYMFKFVKKPWMSFPMIVETIENFPERKPFCLPSESHKLPNIVHDFYQYKRNVSELKVLNTDSFPGFIDTNRYEKNTDGVLVDKEDGTLVGLGVTPGDKNEKRNGGFLNIIWLAKDLCKLFGICEKHVVISPPTVAPTKTPPQKTGKLSDNENFYRKTGCGVQPNANILGFVTTGKTHSMMTMISSRHYLTNSNILLNRKTWGDEKCQGEGKSIISVHPSEFGLLTFSWADSTKINKAWILCDKTTTELQDLNSGLPMIIEVSPNFNGSKPCLPSDQAPLKQNEPVIVYQYGESGKSGKYFRATPKFKTDGQPFIYTDTYTGVKSKSGNPLFKVAEKKWTIVGVSTGVNGMFFSVRWMLKELCDLAGTCEAEPKATVPPPVTKPPATVPPVATEAPTTVAPITEKPTPVKLTKPTTVPTVPPKAEAPTTEKPADPSTLAPATIKAEEPTTEALTFTTTESQTPEGSENSTITDSLNSDNSTTFEPSTPEEPTPPEPEPMEPIKTIDLDEEFEEFKEWERNEKTLDDEWDNDFYRSADFFESSGRRTELFVGFLMVVWRMVLGQ